MDDPLGLPPLASLRVITHEESHGLFITSSESGHLITSASLFLRRRSGSPARSYEEGITQGLKPKGGGRWGPSQNLPSAASAPRSDWSVLRLPRPNSHMS